ncbi:7363_t:CDS:2, partial [Acaulospora colombiana]
EPICSNIIDTTNKLLMDRLKIKRDYTWDPVTNEATKYIDELIDNSDTRSKFRSKLQLPFVSPDEHIHLANTMKYIGSIVLLTNSSRNPLLDKNSEGWQNCHILTPLIDDCFLTCEKFKFIGEEISLASTERKNLSREESGKKQSGHKIDILFRIDDVEYFGSETYVDEDPQNSKPISYKHKILREMKDQLDRLLKKLKFTKETIKWIKNIVVHGINQREHTAKENAENAKQSQTENTELRDMVTKLEQKLSLTCPESTVNSQPQSRITVCPELKTRGSTIGTSSAISPEIIGDPEMSSIGVSKLKAEN